MSETATMQSPDILKQIEMEKAAEAAAFTTNQKFTITVKTSVLKEAVGRVSSSIATKTTIPILTGLYMKVDADTITLRGSDGKITTQTVIHCERGSCMVEGDTGGIVLPGKQFTDLLARLSGVNTIIDVNGLKAKIKSKGAEVDMSGQHIDMYPQLEEVYGDNSFTIPSEVLAMMYKRTDYAVSKNQATPVLTGVLHSIKDKQFKTAACDRHRLAQQVYNLEGDVLDARITVPAEAIVEVKKALKHAPTTRIRFNETNIVYEIGETKIYSSIFEAEYPDIERLIPPGISNWVEISSKELKEVFDRCNLFRDISQEGVLAHVIINAKQNRMRVLSMKTAEGHQFKEDLRLMKGEGEDAVFSCNVKYFLDLLGSIGADEQIMIGYNEPMTPIIVRMANGMIDNLDLVLPIRVQGAPETTEIKDFSPVEFEGDPFAERIAAYGEMAS